MSGLNKIVDGVQLALSPDEAADFVALQAAFATRASRAAWAELREQRNARLSASDWTQLADAPVEAARWTRYRQALRDLPDITTDPNNIVWPTSPAAIISTS